MDVRIMADNDNFSYRVKPNVVARGTSDHRGVTLDFGIGENHVQLRWQTKEPGHSEATTSRNVITLRIPGDLSANDQSTIEAFADAF